MAIRWWLLGVLLCLSGCGPLPLDGVISEVAPRAVSAPARPQAQLATLPAATPAAEPPLASPTATRHAVASGETLGRIASRYGVTVQALIEVNQIENPDRLAIGQMLEIPVVAPPVVVVPSPAPSATAPPAATIVPGKMSEPDYVAFVESELEWITAYHEQMALRLAEANAEPSLTTDTIWHAEVTTTMRGFARHTTTVMGTVAPARYASFHVQFVEMTMTIELALALLQQGVEDADSAALLKSADYLQQAAALQAALPLGELGLE